MSTSINQLYNSWKSLEQSVRGTQIVYRGSTLSATNASVVQEGLLLLAHVWVDCFAPELSLNQIPRWIPRWIKHIEGIDWFDFSRFMKACDDLLLSLLKKDLSQELSNFDDFKHRLRVEFAFAGDILSPARKRIDSYLMYHGIGDAFSLHQAFAFVSRLSLRDVPELASEMLEKFTKNCDRIMKFDHDFYQDPERKIISQWLSTPCFDKFLPKHGNGSVAEKGIKSVAEKYRCGGPDSLLQYVARSRDLNFSWPFSTEKMIRISRLQLVPKSSTSYRTVTMEPACLMYFQEGIKNMLDWIIRKQVGLREHVDLLKQDSSRTLCKFASVDGTLDTIDLSMASDSISFELVKAWFRDTWIYPFLIAARSHSVTLPTGEILKLPIYAGMGSAITFRLECIVFAAICEATIQEVGRRPHEIAYRVYGDDIIIPHRYTDRLIEKLESLGFQVNLDKSFNSSTPFGVFRESCGAECLNGRDIKPCRIPRRFMGYDMTRLLNERHPTCYGTLISLANDCLDHSLFQTRWWIIKQLNDLPIALRPMFGPNDSQVHSLYKIQNHALQKLYCDDYFASIIMHGCVCQKTDRLQRDEEIRLYETLRLISDRKLSGYDLMESEPISVSRPRPPLLTSIESSID